MNKITITLPAIDETVIANLETLTIDATAMEIDALRAVREKYATLARQNGVVRIGWTYRGDGNNWREEKEYYYEREGKRVKALRCIDNFEKAHDNRNNGRRIGDRLYLLETAEWLRIEQHGNWSAWQGASEGWACGEGIIDKDESDYDTPYNTGSIRVLSDADVATEYELDRIVRGLADSLETLAQKLPERMKHVKQRAELAAQLIHNVVDAKQNPGSPRKETKNEI